MLPQLARFALVSTVLAAPAPAPTGAAVLTGLTYDPARQALAIPFTGAVPSFEVHLLSPTRAYFDISPARYAGKFTLHAPDRGEFSRVTMANRPEAGTVRVSFYMGRTGKPDMTWDRQRHRLLITIGPGGPAPAGTTPTPKPGTTAKPGATPKPGTTPKPGATAKPGATSKPGPSATPPALATPKPQPAAATTFKTVYFDSGRGLIVLPFSGAVPGYNLSQPVPGDLAIDFANAALAKPGSIRQDLDRNPLVRRWTAAELPGAAKRTTRVTLGLAASAEVGVAQDPSLGAMLVIPEPLADSAPAGPLPKGGRTRLATPVFDPRTSELTLTYAGPAPTYSLLRPTNSSAYLDLPHSELIAGSMPFERVELSQLVTFWLLAGRPAVDGQRLILHLPFGGDVKVTPDANGRKLVVKLVPPSQGLPPAESPAPAPAATPQP